MGFTVENKKSTDDYAIVKFVFTEIFTTHDMSKVLDILTSLLDTGKPFAFYVDSRTANKPPMNAASNLLKWLRSNKSRFKKQLICSCVIFGNSVTNSLVSRLLKGVFMIQAPVSPNKLTNNYTQGEEWVMSKVDEFMVNNQ